MSTLADTELRLVIATSRPAIVTFFRRVGEYLQGLTVTTIPVASVEIEGEPSLAVVDIAPDAVAGIECCRELRAHHPTMPVAALLCCPQAVDPWQLQSLFRSGVSSILDLQIEPEEAAQLIVQAACGAAVLHLHLRRAHRSLLRDLFVDRGAHSEARLRLLMLVARGLPDHEIGRRLHLSPHTVKHHIESLRAELGLGNRIELAAWAGRHGFYTGEPEPTATVRTRLARPQ
jgi:DNA-binding NarL/FixJ family response regulator